MAGRHQRAMPPPMDIVLAAAAAAPVSAAVRALKALQYFIIEYFVMVKTLFTSVVILVQSLMMPSVYVGESIPIPSPAFSHGFTNRVFFDDFTSINTIDINNTKSVGYNWYTNNSWTSASYPWVTLAPTSSSDISIADGVLRLANDASGIGECLNSAVQADNASGYIGTVFGGGAYFEARISYDSTLSKLTSTGTPAFWTLAIEYLVGNASEFAEIDVFEAIPTGSDGMVRIQSTLHDWAANNKNPVVITSITGQPVGFHIYGLLWVPASKNGSTGLIEMYYDGTLVASTVTNYSSSAGAIPSFEPSNPNGVFSIVDSQHFPLILGCGTNWPMNIDWVKVYQ